MHRILHGFFRNRDYPFVAPEYSSFGVVVGYGKGGVVPITTKLSSHKYYFWLGGVDLVLSKSRYHSAMVTGNGRGVVGPSTTHFSSKKVVFKRVIHNGGFISSQHEQTSSNLTSSFIKDYSVGGLGVSKSDVVGGKVGVGLRISHLNSQKVFCCIYRGTFMSSQSRDSLSMGHS